jgi:putative membrane protein
MTARAATTAANLVPAVAASNLFAIDSSELAPTRSSSKDVKDFAHCIIVDYNLAGSKFKQAPGDAKMPVPSAKLDAEQRGIIDNLKSATGTAFDKAYIDAQYKAHAEAVALFKAYARAGDNPRLRAFAVDVLPTLQADLEYVSKLR